MNRIFKEAARRIAEKENSLSCIAIMKTMEDAGLRPYKIRRYVNKYSSCIAPLGKYYILSGDFEPDYQPQGIDARQHRVMALLMIGEAWGDL